MQSRNLYKKYIFSKCDYIALRVRGTFYLIYQGNAAKSRQPRPLNDNSGQGHFQWGPKKCPCPEPFQQSGCGRGGGLTSIRRREQANYPQKRGYTSFAEKFGNPFKNFSAKHLNHAFYQLPSESFDNSRLRLLYLFRLFKEQGERNNAVIISMLVECAFDIVFRIQPLRRILDDTLLFQGEILVKVGICQRQAKARFLGLKGYERG